MTRVQIKVTLDFGPDHGGKKDYHPLCNSVPTSNDMDMINCMIEEIPDYYKISDNIDALIQESVDKIMKVV